MLIQNLRLEHNASVIDRVDVINVMVLTVMIVMVLLLLVVMARLQMAVSHYLKRRFISEGSI